MTFEIGLLVASAILALATLPVLHRMIVGPTILDRAVAADMLSVLLVMAVGIYVAYTRTAHGVPVMLAMTAFAFLGSVAVARFVAREDQGLEPARAEGERTEGPPGDGARDRAYEDQGDGGDPGGAEGADEGGAEGADERGDERRGPRGDRTGAGR